MTDPRRPLGAVWPTDTRSLAEQLEDRGYVDRSRTDLRLMPPVIAEHAVLALTRPGDIVLDPDCGAGSTIVEALRAGRYAIGFAGGSRAEDEGASPASTTTSPRTCGVWSSTYWRRGG
jgi:hypothetical protein